MKKVNIEVMLSDDIFFNHAFVSVMDALWFSENVTQAEYDLINQVLNKLQETTKQNSDETQQSS